MTNLKDASGLRELRFPIRAINSATTAWYRAITPDRIAVFAETAMRKLKQTHDTANDGVNVLDIIKLTSDRCRECKPLAPAFASDAVCTGIYLGYNRGTEKCGEIDERRKELEKKTREMLAKRLDIEK